MTANLIQVKYDQLEQCARICGQESQRIEQLQRKLAGYVGKISEFWIGLGADEFEAEMTDQFLPRLKRLTQALHESQSAIQQISETFYQAEELASGVFNDQIGNPFLNFKKIGDTEFTGMETVTGVLAIQGAGDGHAFHPSDAQQGYLGNCYFVSALAAIVGQNPDFIQNNIQDNGDGTYTVTLYRETRYWTGFGTGEYEPIEVVVTPEFPGGNPADPRMVVNDTLGSDSELWALLYEKAYAQYHGGDDVVDGYNDIIGGFGRDAMTTLTGQPSASGGAHHYSLEQLGEMYSEGHAMTLGSQPGLLQSIGLAPTTDLYTNGTLITNHEYYITGVDVTAGTVTLRNPWGYHLPEITVPYDQLDENFREIAVNPVTDRP